MFKFKAMLGKLLFALVIITGFCIDLRAQDPQFSQFYNAPLYLNPGFTGATQSNRVILNYRLQWPNLPQTFATYAFSWDLYRPELRSGFGALVWVDKTGSAALTNTNVDLFYSYKLQYDDKWVITPGLYFGYGISNIDIEKLLLGDQLQFDGGNAPTLDPAIARLGNTQYFDFGTGVLMYSSKHWFGISVYHLTRPNVSLLESESRLPMKWNIHGGTSISLSKGFRPSPTSASLVPFFQFKKQSSIEQLDIGINYVVPPVTMGVTYRGIPLQAFSTEPPDGSGIPIETFNPSKDALVFLLGLQITSLQFAYNFDFALSELSSSSGGAHEVSLIYEFELVNPRRVKRKNKLIPCPTFNNAGGGLNPFKKN
jgi:type IX secretion system PorP/SprF family membrane protein